MCEHSAYRKWLIKTQTVFQTEASRTPSKKSYTHQILTGWAVKHKHAIYSSLTFSWQYFGEYMFQFPSFHSPLFEATDVWVGRRNLKSIKNGNVEQTKALKLNQDSSRRERSKHWHVSCWFSVTCNQLCSFSSFFFFFSPDKGLQIKPPRWNNRAMIVVGIKWNLSVTSPPPFQHAAPKPREGEEKPKNVPLVQWLPLSNCRLIHSKQNGKCLSNETESVFIAQSRDQPAQFSGRASTCNMRGEENKVEESYEKHFQCFTKYPASINLTLLIFHHFI